MQKSHPKDGGSSVCPKSVLVWFPSTQAAPAAPPGVPARDRWMEARLGPQAGSRRREPGTGTGARVGLAEERRRSSCCCRRCVRAREPACREHLSAGRRRTLFSLSSFQHSEIGRGAVTPALSPHVPSLRCPPTPEEQGKRHKQQDHTCSCLVQ